MRLILGGPGCGKTTALVNEVRKLLKTCEPDEIGFVAFTRKAADEARDRCAKDLNLDPKDMVYFRTIHSLCFRELALNRNQVMQDTDYQRIAKDTGIEVNRAVDQDFGLPTGTALGDKIIFLEQYARSTGKHYETVLDKNNINAWLGRQYRANLNAYKQSRGLWDFTDMIEKFIAYGLTPSLKVLVVDEAQDLSHLHWRVVDMLAAKAGRLIIAGDDDQCCKPDVLVNTTRGKKRIDELDPKIDRLLSYSIKDTYVYGKKNGGYKFQVNARPYNGAMVKVNTVQHETAYTLNHKMIVKWVQKDTRWNVVYLMRKGNWFRIGWCQLFRSDGIFHFADRVRKEKAEQGWIIRLCNNKKEASTWESIYAAKYGIPTCPFEPSERLIYYDRESLTFIFSHAPGISGGHQLLRDENLLLSHPLIDRRKPTHTRHGTTVWPMAAANVNKISPVLSIPVYMGCQKPSWVKFSTAIYHYNGAVYSLNVEPHHTYVGDNIITHNCLYRWAGADIKRFLSLDGERVVLPVSHRLPQTIFKLANRILGRISKRYPKEWRPRDEEGEILNLDMMDKLAKYLKHGSWYCLARHAYLLPHYKKIIERNGFVYEYKGRSSTDTTDTRAIIAWERLRKGKEVSLQECQLINRRLHANLKTDVFDRLDDITDEGQTYDVAQLRAMGLRATPDWVEALHVSNREYYRACLINGEKLTEPPRIKLATVHGVKGGEADNVAILPDLSNKAHKSLMQKPDNEHRVFYVGATRARHRLFLMAPRGALTYAF